MLPVYTHTHTHAHTHTHTHTRALAQMTFNPRDHWVYAMAVTLQNLFENTW